MKREQATPPRIARLTDLSSAQRTVVLALIQARDAAQATPATPDQTNPRQKAA